MQESSVISSSPSFNSYSNSKLAEIAARVVKELASEESREDDFYFDAAAVSRSEEGGDLEKEEERSVEDADEAEFEFAFVMRDSELLSPISADEIFHNGRIRPLYPVFNRDSFLENSEVRRENVEEKSDSNKAPTVRLPLRKLFSKERETTMTMTTTSSSSSDADELDGIPEESYCVWRPKEAAADGRWKKSTSAGSNSKRWRFRDLLNRSHSDGGFVVLSPSNSGRKKQNENRGKVAPESSGKVKPAALPPVYNREGGEKRRSYLPYKQDLVGFFSNINGIGKNLQPF